jgi:hypothetical protein
MLQCMRTTIRMDDALYARVKELAARTGRTVTSVIEDALRESLARRTVARQRERIELPTFTGSGVQPGVDLDSYASLLDLMEGSGGPR